MQKPEYSVIVPVFNSEQTLDDLFAEIQGFFTSAGLLYEVIFVDDGSTDSSWQILTRLKEKNADIITAVKLSMNFGQHNAVFCGLTFVHGKYVVTMDDDLQVKPAEIKGLISEYEKSEPDLVYGYFEKKKHSWFRNLGSLYIKKSAKLLHNSPGEGSSFRLFTSELANKILNHNQNFVFLDELLLWYTNSISFVKVEHHKREKGKSGYSKIKLFRLAINTMFYYTAIPLKLMTYGGFISSVISFLIGLFYIFKKVALQQPPPGYTSIIVTVLFSTSIIIFSLGIIGEYLSRIYMMQNKKPPYSIKKVL